MASGRIYTTDTAVLVADIFSDEDGTPQPASGSLWRFVDPTGSNLIYSSLPSSPTTNQIVMLDQATGGFNAWDVVKWNGSSWVKIDQGSSTLTEEEATVAIPGTLTGSAGLYRGYVQFTLPGSVKKSQPIDFEVINPIEAEDSLDNQAPYDENWVVNHTWMKLEDLFDSELGGPWLRDKTFSSFDKNKIRRFAPDAVYRINVDYQPNTSFSEATFPYATDAPLFSQSLLVETIYHLMRSYTERPSPEGANITWFDRRDYLNRWGQTLEKEETKYLKWLDTFKKQFMGYGQTATLVGGYSGIYSAPRFMRSRFPYVFRW